MKKLSAFGFGLFAVFLLAATSNASNTPAPTPVQPTPPQTLQPIGVTGPFRLLSVTKAPPPQNMNSFVLDVAVENYSNNPIRMGVEVTGLGPVQQVPSVAAHATQHFFFTDPTGGPPTCSAFTMGKDYTILISDMGTNNFTHHVDMKRTACTHTEKWVRPWDQSYSTDSIADYQQHYLYINSVTASPAQTCDTKGKYKVVIVNNSPTPQTFRVVAKRGATIEGEVKDISLGKNKSTTVDLALTSWVYDATFYIEGASGNFVAQSYIKMMDEAKCTDSTQLDPPQSTAPPTQIK